MSVEEGKSELTVSFAEYEKLQLEFIESQKELKDITELFDSYRKETESMEDLQSRQIEMQEQQLEKAQLEKDYLMVTLKKELQEISIETQKLLLEKEDEVQSLREELKLKTQKMTKILSQYSEQKKQQQEGQSEGDQSGDKDEIISELKKDLVMKEFIIQDLTSDIQKNKLLMDAQKKVFKQFSEEILKKTNERDESLLSLKNEEIEQLQEQLKHKSELIEQLEGQNLEQTASEEENALMREMITQQQDKLMSLAKNFEKYRDESEKLFLGQISVRDQTIKDQQKQIDQLTSNSNGLEVEKHISE